MNTREQVRSLIIRLTAAQLHTTPDQITDETEVPDIHLLMLDASRSLCMAGRIHDVQHFSTVGDAIKAFTPDDLPCSHYWRSSGPPADLF